MNCVKRILVVLKNGPDSEFAFIRSMVVVDGFKLVLAINCPKEYEHLPNHPEKQRVNDDIKEKTWHFKEIQSCYVTCPPLQQQHQDYIIMPA